MLLEVREAIISEQSTTFKTSHSWQVEDAMNLHGRPKQVVALVFMVPIGHNE